MAIRSTRSSINFWMRIALTQRNRRTPHADIVDNLTSHRAIPMRRPSDVFIGTIIGLILGLFVTRDYIDTEAAVVTWLVFFPGMGACVGTLVHIVRHRRA
jgi:hypothetical protein